MDNAKIKENLLEIRNTNLEFEVIQSGSESKRVNGLYKPDTREIILHNKNFKDDNQLMYTAVHEYTHHLLNEKALDESNGKITLNTKSAHNTAFWALFHELLSIAEEKGFYSLSIATSPALEELTQKIQKEYIAKNGELMIGFGKLLIEAQKLCEEASIRYEDYIDRVLQLPRTTAQQIKSVGASANVLNPEMGFENMKMLASIKNKDKRQEAESELSKGKAPVSVRSMMKSKTNEVDQKTKLEREKARLEKTIAALNTRLEIIEDALEGL